MREIRISSKLPVVFREELERIVFFNGDQERVKQSLLESIKRHGIPAILEEEGLLRFRIPEYGPVQSLFAFDETDDKENPRLAAVALFTRKSRTTMLLIHLVTHEDFTLRGQHADAAVTVRLLNALRELSARVRGVTTLRSEYPRPLNLLVRPAAGKVAGKSRPALPTPEAPRAGKKRLRLVTAYT